MYVEFAGTWVLNSFNIIDPTEKISPWGKNTTDLLLYTPDGHMSVSINRAANPLGPNSHKDLFDSILFYAGSYSMEGNIISHKVTNASNPSRIGKEMIRHAKLQEACSSLNLP